MNRCPHDLDPRACAACAGPSPSRDRRPTSGTFTARYDGTCSGCGFDVRPGDWVRYDADAVVHERCSR